MLYKIIVYYTGYVFVYGVLADTIGADIFVNVCQKWLMITTKYHDKKKNATGIEMKKNDVFESHMSL